MFATSLSLQTPLVNFRPMASLDEAKKLRDSPKMSNQNTESIGTPNESSQRSPEVSLPLTKIFKLSNSANRSADPQLASHEQKVVSAQNKSTDRSDVHREALLVLSTQKIRPSLRFSRKPRKQISKIISATENKMSLQAKKPGQLIISIPF